MTTTANATAVPKGDPRFRCPRCGNLAVGVAHHLHASVACCMDGHEWDPFDAAHQPAPQKRNPMASDDPPYPGRWPGVA